MLLTLVQPLKQIHTIHKHIFLQDRQNKSVSLIRIFRRCHNLYLYQKLLILLVIAAIMTITPKAKFFVFNRFINSTINFTQTLFQNLDYLITVTGPRYGIQLIHQVVY
eukprot:g71060.t1